jgi:hypothetical protein
MIALRGKIMKFKEKILWKSWTKIGCKYTFLIDLEKNQGTRLFNPKLVHF